MRTINYRKIALWAISARRIGYTSAERRWLRALMEGLEPDWAPYF
jgi:hypothetical protein